MSHYSTVKTSFSDCALLVKALNAVGYSKVEVHDDPTSLFGYRGDLRPQRANVVVRRQFVGALSNDLGFLRRPDGKFEAIISDYDRNRLNESWMSRLKVEYAKLTVLEYASQQGFELAKASKGAKGDTRFVLKKRMFVAR